jgi:hypothetical protein
MEEKKLTEEELEELKNLNQRYNNILNVLGEYEISIAALNEQLKKVLLDKEGALSDYTTLKKNSESFSESLLTKYGPGKIDVETGKIEAV